jgi:hypothetical protein
MTRAYVVTEGKTDTDILKKLLPQSSTVDMEFVSGSGSYAAQSLARTILSVRGRPVALVLDADTMDDQAVQEKRAFLCQMLHTTQTSAAFEAFIAIPQIESILFYDKSVFERIIGHASSEAEWRLAQAQPRKYLEEHVQEHEPLVRAVFAKLTEQDIEKLRRHPLISQLDDFLKRATEEYDKTPTLAP